MRGPGHADISHRVFVDGSFGDSSTLVGCNRHEGNIVYLGYLGEKYDSFEKGLSDRVGFSGAAYLEEDHSQSWA